MSGKINLAPLAPFMGRGAGQITFSTCTEYKHAAQASVSGNAREFTRSRFVLVKLRLPSFKKCFALGARGARFVCWCLVFVSFSCFQNASADDRPEFCVIPYTCPTAGRLMPQVGERGKEVAVLMIGARLQNCLLYTSPSPRDKRQSRMPSSA